MSASRALAHQRNSLRIDAQLTGMLVYPAKRGVIVLHRSLVRCFRSKAILNRRDETVELPRPVLCWRHAPSRITQKETTAVRMNDRGPGRSRLGIDQVNGDRRAARHWDPLLDPGHILLEDDLFRQLLRLLLVDQRQSKGAGSILPDTLHVRPCKRSQLRIDDGEIEIRIAAAIRGGIGFASGQHSQRGEPQATAKLPSAQNHYMHLGVITSACIEA